MFKLVLIQEEQRMTEQRDEGNDPADHDSGNAVLMRIAPNDMDCKNAEDNREEGKQDADKREDRTDSAITRSNSPARATNRQDKTHPWIVAQILPIRRAGWHRRPTRAQLRPTRRTERRTRLKRRSTPRTITHVSDSFLDLRTS